jgi:hypothetical protein
MAICFTSQLGQTARSVVIPVEEDEVPDEGPFVMEGSEALGPVAALSVGVPTSRMAPTSGSDDLEDTVGGTSADSDSVVIPGGDAGRGTARSMLLRSSGVEDDETSMGLDEDPTSSCEVSTADAGAGVGGTSEGRTAAVDCTWQDSR